MNVHKRFNPKIITKEELEENKIPSYTPAFKINSEEQIGQ